MQRRPAREAASGTAIRTFLIADIRGYTDFTAEHGDEAAAELASRFAAVTRERVEAHSGELIELRGDEALVVFDSAREAIRTAIELQRQFVDQTVSDPRMPLPVGIGLDAGEAVPVEDGYRGGALNLAARLCALAGPAEILASRELIHLARKVAGVAYVDRGPVRLKGLPDPVHVIRLRAEAEDAADDVAFRRALGPSAARLLPTLPGVMAPNPYKGLRAFEEADAPDFFGREQLVQLLVDRLATTRFLAVVGPSGSGKSSVVRAGLIPALRRGALPGSSGWAVAQMLPGANPLEEVEAALLRVAANPPTSLIEQLARDEHGLLRAAKRVLPEDGSEIVLVIDQFEEVFTLVGDEGVRSHFLDSLEAAVTDPRSPLRAVVTLRADFYDRPLRYRGFAELLRSRVEAVVPLSPDELERAIAGPAQRVDVRLEQGLVARMLADVTDQPGGLPLMEYALTELFERRDGNVLTLDAYRSLGGVSGALGRRAEELYGKFDAAGKDSARQLLLRLVALGEGTEDTRRPVPRSEIDSLDLDRRAMTTVIDAFGAARLLSFDRDARSGAPTVEVAHEALLTAWDRLRGWIDDAREDLRTERRLAAAAQEWADAGRDPSFLATGSRLEQFETWRATSGLSITPLEHEYLEASVAERARLRAEEITRLARERALERRSIRRLRAFVAMLAVAAIVAGGLTVFAFNQRGRAEREGRVATARELAAAAVANLDADPERSILLALEAVERTRSVDGSVLPEAEEALHRAVLASRIVLTVPGLGGLLDWSPDGLFVTEGPEESGLVDIRDAETGESVRSFHGHDVDVNAVAFSGDGSMLATTGDDGAARVSDPATGEELQTFRGPNGQVWGPSFSPDGSLMAASWPDEGLVRVFDLTSGRTVREIGPSGVPFTTSFSPDGGRLAISSLDPPVASVVDVSSGEEVFTLRGHEGPLMDVDWSPDGRWLATSSDDSTVRLWEAVTGKPRFTVFGHTAPIVTADWNPDSTRLVTGSGDGTAKVWEITEAGSRELLSLSSEGGGGRPAVFSPDGNRVMTGDQEITVVKVWDVSGSGDAEWANIATEPGLQGVAFTPDGRHVVAGGSRGSVTVSDADTGLKTLTLRQPGPSKLVEGLAIDVSADGELIARAGPSAEVWDATTGEEAFTVISPEGVEDVAWSPDGELLAAAMLEGGVKIVDRSGQELATLPEDPGYVIATVRFSPDGRLLATARYTDRAIGVPEVKIWDWEQGEVVRRIRSWAWGVAFDPTGTRIATATAFGLTEIWDVGSGKRVTTLAGHSGPVFDVAFSPDGSVLATAGSDRTVRVWDLRSGVQVVALRGHKTVVWDIAFSPDGSKLASSSPDGTVRVWALDLDDLIELAEAELTRELTEEECRQYLHQRCPPN